MVHAPPGRRPGEAYCRWLSRQRGEEIRLPREAEWEQAATPEKGEYPWGEEEPDTERANFKRKVGEPTPVGIYPLGDGPFGHCDLAGNVWEWCLERYGEDVEELWGTKEVRVLRGGGWSYTAEFLRAAYRGRDRPSKRSNVIGFRVLAAPAVRAPPTYDEALIRDRPVSRRPGEGVDPRRCRVAHRATC